VPPAEAYEGETLGRLLEAGLALLPAGRAFTRRKLALVPRVLEALLIELARVHLEAQTILAHVSPRRARREDYLRAWEAAADTPSSGTPEERANRVAAKIRGGIGRTLADFDAAAAALGFEISGPAWTHPLFQAGISAAGDPVRADSWRFFLTFPVSGGSAEDWPLLAEAWSALTRAHTLVVPGYATDRTQVVDGAGNPVVDDAGNRVVT
jgi:uncharacterized protein YmfQ (DUF2313 family)